MNNETKILVGFAKHYNRWNLFWCTANLYSL